MCLLNVRNDLLLHIAVLKYSLAYLARVKWLFISYVAKLSLVNVHYS
jgi:hypothetical protein